MMPAIRNKLSQVERSQGAHAGLLLRRFLHVAVKDQEKKHSADRAELHRDAISASHRSCDLYRQTFHRWQSQLPTAVVRQELSTAGRLIVGLGGDNVLETGITLHHTYGTPIIPGSALKGLAAHYCDQVWGARMETDATKLTDDNHRFRRLRRGEKRGYAGVHPDAGQHHENLFGTTEDSGHIIFHDAWITPDSLKDDGSSGLVLDVMTPHHSDYYSDKTYEAGPDKRHLIPPTDFDDPTPITFLSASGSFLVSISCDVPGPTGDAWAKLALDILTEALRDWGVGGKTSSGYGRLGTNDAKSNASIQFQQSVQAPRALAKRASGSPTKVTILVARPKGGFNVMEPGRPQGTLTLGPTPSSPPQLNDTVDVLVHVDDHKTPQYKWPDPNAKSTKHHEPTKRNRR